MKFRRSGLAHRCIVRPLDSGRMTAKQEVMPTDLIRAITSGLPIHPERAWSERRFFGKCKSREMSRIQKG
jgi:hypothetical protein